jgi:hypothetical protein
MNTFVKFDGGKPQFHHIADLMRELGMINDVMEYGATKYEKDNWKLGGNATDIRRNVNASIRHSMAFLRGEITDDESTKPHLAHAIVDLLFALWHINENQEFFVLEEEARQNAVKTAQEALQVPEE